jgi:hypothetical protein
LLLPIKRGLGRWKRVVGTSEYFFGDKMREELTLVGAFPEGTTVTG